MASIGEITVDVHVTDQSIHEIFKELAQKIYDESGIVINGVSFSWYEPYNLRLEKTSHLCEVKINSSK
jgi:ABC-type metal ion transport system substrate-binding protein